MKRRKDNSRRWARRAIVVTANRNRIDPSVKPYSMRRIQDAVCTVRSRNLVKPKLLEDAGYRSAK